MKNNNIENLEPHGMTEPKHVSVSVKFNLKHDINQYLQATSIEYFGTLLDIKETKTTSTMLFLFENAKFGKEFHDMLVKSQVKAMLKDC